jgi:2-keto-4-pentenoate hydratase/2-oxohepta-3-ene-1,7-dioic acid hydratase in catechol pathway
MLGREWPEVKEEAMQPRLIALWISSVLTGSVELCAQAQPEPFKLGTFERQGRTFLGLVLRDAQVVDIAQANTVLEGRNSSWPKVSIPGEMKDLIARYEAGLKDRLYAMVNALGAVPAAAPYVHPVRDLKVLPPVRPAVVLNAGGNYEEHTQGIAQQQQKQQKAAAAPAPAPPAVSAPGLWERKAGDARGNPYLFIKLPSAVIGHGDTIRIPPGRERIDYECELGIVIGQPAKRVPLERAAASIFGYTAENDVSDRGGRGDSRFGSDWLVGKNHDTFAPLGPYIVPREFVKDPMNLSQTLTLNGERMQNSNTRQMTHNVFELLHYASNNLRLQPGDVIAAGSPPGTNIERSQPRWMKPGDTVVCTIEGIGSLSNPVAADSL